MGSNIGSPNMNLSLEYAATIKSNIEPKKKGKSTARSRNDIVEVSQKNTFMSIEYEQLDSFSGTQNGHDEIK